MSGGEPLSPELEAKVHATWDRIFAWKEGDGSERYGLKEILRAFAREIQQAWEIANDDATAELMRELSASQESCRLLAEALVRISMTCCMNVYAEDKAFWCKPEEGRHSIYCAEGMARKALHEAGLADPPVVVDRSSEAGKEKA